MHVKAEDFSEFSETQDFSEIIYALNEVYKGRLSGPCSESKVNVGDDEVMRIQHYVLHVWMKFPPLL